jgi:hypothetical protein
MQEKRGSASFAVLFHYKNGTRRDARHALSHRVHVAGYHRGNPLPFPFARLLPPAPPAASGRPPRRPVPLADPGVDLPYAIQW